MRLEQLGSNMRRKKKRTLTLSTSHIPKINLRWIIDHRSTTVKAKTMKALLENVERISLGPRGKYLNQRNKVVAKIEKNKLGFIKAKNFYIHISYHYIAHLKLIQCYTSIISITKIENFCLSKKYHKTHEKSKQRLGEKT